MNVLAIRIVLYHLQLVCPNINNNSDALKYKKKKHFHHYIDYKYNININNNLLTMWFTHIVQYKVWFTAEENLLLLMKLKY